MFYCDPCGESRGWPQGFARSRGPCEVCKEVRDCSDVASKNLSIPGKTMEETRAIDAKVIDAYYKRMREKADA